MKKKNLYWMLMLLLCTACHKEGTGVIELLIEPIGGNNAKLTVDNTTYTTSAWTDGDVINFNGMPVAVERSGENGKAYISDVTSLSVNRACFPSNLSTGSLNDDNIHVTLPAEYHYELVDGRQKVDMPMVARAADGEAMQFKHLTSALCLIFTNDQGVELTIDRITVSSGTYRLNGDFSVNLGSIGSFGPQAYTSGADTTVTMLFDRQKLVIADDGSATVLIPVPPVGDGNRFTVTVSARYQGTRYTYTRRQGSGGALGRSIIAYASQTLSSGTTSNLFSGSGSAGNPCILSSSTDVIAMEEACANNWYQVEGVGDTPYKTRNYKLANDIDMAGVTLSSIKNFAGATFDGDGHTISNFTIEGYLESSAEYCGFFGDLSVTTVSDLTLSNVTLKRKTNASYLYLGTFAGHISGTTLNNCDVDGLTIQMSGSTSATYCGGLAGYAEGSNTLTSCDVSYSQTLTCSSSDMRYGGLLGCCEPGTSNAPTMTGCNITNTALNINNNGNLTVGGLVGYCRGETMTMTSCHWLGTMTVDCDNKRLYVGGLMGWLFKLASGTKLGRLTATNCSVSGTITATTSGTRSTGAFVGFTSNSPTVDVSTSDSTGLTIN